MIKVIGKQNCSSCEMVKNILKNKNIDFTYSLLDELEIKEKKEYIELARKNGKLSMPLIIKDGKLLELKEVIA